MPGSRRVRGLAAVGALAVVLELAPGASEPAAEAAPRAFTIVGGGWGHGIGMSQYEVRVRFGRRNDLGVVGDWNGNGTWTPGVLRAGSRWYLKDSLAGGAASVGLKQQIPGTPVVATGTTGPSLPARWCRRRSGAVRRLGGRAHVLAWRGGPGVLGPHAVAWHGGSGPSFSLCGSPGG
jgi:hypothetical protein